MKIAIIGTGNLGLAIAKGLLQADQITTLWLTKRNTDALADWKQYNEVTVRHSDILIFAVQPRHFEDILDEIKNHLQERHILISTITGYKISQIAKQLGMQHQIIRAMPNTAIAVSQSMTCLCSNTAGQKSLQIATNIFDKMGASLIIPEEQMQAATVICASGIAFWMRLIRATTQGAIQLGFDAQEAQQLAMQTCLGAASLVINLGTIRNRKSIK